MNVYLLFYLLSIICINCLCVGLYLSYCLLMANKREYYYVLSRTIATANNIIGKCQ